MNVNISDSGIKLQLVEECGELQQVLCKTLRERCKGAFPVRKTTGTLYEELAEEIADVELLLGALMRRLGPDFCEAVSGWKIRKVEEREELRKEVGEFL